MTLARDLKRRKARERQGLFVAEGIRTVEGLLASPLRVRGILVSDALGDAPRGAALLEACAARGLDVQRVSAEDFASAADTEQPQGVLAVAECPAHSLDGVAVAATMRLLVLDGIQDPGNVGTLLRTASALGCAATLVLPGTVDPWNAKVVRSAVGLQFSHPTISCTPEEMLAFLSAQGVALWGADATGSLVGTTAAPARLALAVGNEGGGLTPPVRAACAGLVAIPMAAGAESLNVAVAAGILLHVLRPPT
ncbi:MAG: RNA methyltransferase [Gemmatimonadaceae bacterium]|nr:RNA methyltransferase [Gemmatimonadaceae bacterium]MCW5825689.1 RNA methyltransferase [Gemmatimonadaceae bacterium]